MNNFKHLLVIASVGLIVAGCGETHHLEDHSLDVVEVFDNVAESYHTEMGHPPFEGLFDDGCLFARDYRKQREALETRLERVDQSHIMPNLQRVQVLAEAVTHLGRTAKWDTGARGPLLADLHFETDKAWPAYYHRIYRNMVGE